MKIESIQLPDGCSLEGWRRAVFIRRIHRALQGHWFDVSDVARCRADILGPNDSADNELYSDLAAFHCVKYVDMTPEEARMLVQKVAQYVGVSIDAKPENPLFQRFRRSTGVGIGAGSTVVLLAVLLSAALGGFVAAAVQ